ncbi:MAG: hypothetical protein Q8865_04865 [Bacillota bacterium]|nr:hypothetical protein [Bacillota bacterium]
MNVSKISIAEIVIAAAIFVSSIISFFTLSHLFLILDIVLFLLFFSLNAYFEYNRGDKEHAIFYFAICIFMFFIIIIALYTTIRMAGISIPVLIHKNMYLAGIIHLLAVLFCLVGGISKLSSDKTDGIIILAFTFLAFAISFKDFMIPLINRIFS